MPEGQLSVTSFDASVLANIDAEVIAIAHCLGYDVLADQDCASGHRHGRKSKRCGGVGDGDENDEDEHTEHQQAKASVSGPPVTRVAHHDIHDITAPYVMSGYFNDAATTAKHAVWLPSHAITLHHVSVIACL